MNCSQCEARISDYLEKTLGTAEHGSMDLHLNACKSCSELLAGMNDVLVWTRDFPVYDVPAWLPSRILANTPKVVRETWTDTLAAVGRWFIEPRTAMGLLTAVLMIGWMGSLAGVSADVVAAVENPAAVCYSAYDQAVRMFYRAPVVTEIRSQIERLREIS